MIASSSLASTPMSSVRVIAELALVHLPRQPLVVMTGHRAMYQHVSMMAIDLSGAACAARKRAVFHAMGLQTMRHRLVFPPVLTRDKRRAMARDKQGTTSWTRLGAAWPNKCSKGSRWRGGQKAFAQFISICRWWQLIHKDRPAPLEKVPFSTLWARKRYHVAQCFRQY